MCESASNQNRSPFWKTSAKLYENASFNRSRLYEVACFVVFVFKTVLFSVFETLLLILIPKTCLSLWAIDILCDEFEGEESVSHHVSS